MTRKSSAGVSASTKKLPITVVVLTQKTMPTHCWVGQRNWDATLFAWPIIPIMKRWCARPNVWASLYGPKFPCIGRFTGRTRILTKMRSNNCATWLPATRTVVTSSSGLLPTKLRTARRVSRSSLIWQTKQEASIASAWLAQLWRRKKYSRVFWR